MKDSYADKQHSSAWQSDLSGWLDKTTIDTDDLEYNVIDQIEFNSAKAWTDPERHQPDDLEPSVKATDSPMGKKTKAKKAAVVEEAPNNGDGLQDIGQFDERIYKGEEDHTPDRARSLSPDDKVEFPPSLPQNGVPSPGLSALPDDDDAGFDTRAWARNIPYGLSPPNIAPSSGGSPANLPVSGPALGTSPSGPAFNLAGSPPNVHDRFRPSPNEELRGGFGGASPGISPRGGFRLPNKQGGEGQPAASPRGRPLSMPSNYIPPTPPSQRPQPHLRQVSEAEIGMIPSRSTSGMRDTQDLVTFDQAFYDGNIGDVCVHAAGKQLYVYKLEREKLTTLGTLTGLRGTVLAARMLPPAEEDNVEPMVAVIVQGPALIAPDNHSQPTLSQNESQTSVEVYALKAGRHLATLYKAPAQNHSPYSRLSDPANANGFLRLDVAGRFITVTSGASGEVYIFEAKQSHNGRSFDCLGKIWTSMPAARQRTYSVSSASSSNTGYRDESPGSQVPSETGIVSLSQRWLAYVPPYASSQTSLHGEIGVPLSSSREPPGLMAHTSPAQASPNCEAETPLQEHFINKYTRDGYQEVQKGAKWAAERGMSAVKSYWSKADPSPASDANVTSAAYGQQAVFPPTHAQDSTGRSKPSQTCISVVDLERLSEANSTRPDTMIHPTATFPVRYGCRFLSFSPTGLSLFTSDAKGDVSYVWCLMRMIHGSIATPHGDVAAADSHASVRQIARYTRMSESNIIDVVWTKPRGEKLAILTDRGTVHMHDLPASSFRWPPPARHASAASTPRVTSETSASQLPQAKGHLGNALSYLSNTAQTIQAAAKSRPSFSGATIGGVAYAAGARGSRMVAAGFSKSMGAVSATASNLVHSGENRTRLPGSSKARVVTGVVGLLSSKYQDALAITGTGIVRLHAIRLSVTDGGKGKRSVAGEQISQLNVPKHDPDGGAANATDGIAVRSQWFADTKSHGFRLNQALPQPLSLAEIETSTPYRPFHNDHRVTMSTYADDAAFDREAIDDWEFGGDIETVEVGEEELPAGSMHMNKQDIGAGFDEPLDFEDEPALPPTRPSFTAPTTRSSKADKKNKKSRRTEPKSDDLIDVYGDGVDDAPGSDAGVPVKSMSRSRAYDDGFEDDEGLPFGQNSEFGL